MAKRAMKMRIFLFVLGLGLAGCNAIGQATGVGGSGCIVGGFGDYSGTCSATVAGSRLLSVTSR
jgi:hypothetical protein